MYNSKSFIADKSKPKTKAAVVVLDKNAEIPKTSEAEKYNFLHSMQHISRGIFTTVLHALFGNWDQLL